MASAPLSLGPAQEGSRRPGLVVALLGPDGAGKTTLANALAADPALRARRIYMGTNPHAQDLALPGAAWLEKRRRAAGSGARPLGTAAFRMLAFAHRLLAQWRRYAVARRHRRAGGVVVFDRLTIPDAAAKPATGLRHRLMQLGAPEPDLIIVLDASPDLLLRRKGEHTVERLRRMRQEYARLASTHRQAVLVDASQHPDRVRTTVTSLIRRQLAAGPYTKNVTPVPDTPADAEVPAVSGTEMARKQIRGSSLLMSGKLLAVGGKLIAQVLVVRYLTKADYGVWAYALAAVSLLGGFAHLSLDRTVSRFASIYHEQGQFDRFFGTIVLVLGIAIGMSSLMVGGLYAFPELFGRLTGGDPATLALLLVLVFLVPLEAIDTLLTAIFASFSRPRAIFVRRYVVTPLMQVSVVGLLVLLRADLQFLAFGYLAGTLAGVLLSGWMLLSLLREQHLLRTFSLRRITIPARELFSFSVPLMTSDGLSALMHASGALVLGYLFGAEDVALFRVVMPIAVLNQLVLQSFHMLYVPTASRLFARGDMDGVNDLYWRTSLWIAVLTFPLFAVTFTAATPLTVLLFGPQYAESGIILTILVLGQYVQASFGFNGSTLKVVGRVGYIVRINCLTALVHVALTAALIPPFGPLGAAIALTASMITYNVLKQLGLRAAGIRLLDPRYVVPFQIIAGAALALLAIRIAGVSHLAITGTLAAAAAVYVLLSTRRTLRIAEVFPEVRRVPLLRILEP